MRQILHRYGGLAMFDLNITCLGAKLHHLRSHWHQLTPEGDHLRQLYETFLMDVGLGGNIFTKNFNSLGFLAEHNWFKHLWQLCFIYNCDLTLDFPDNPQRARVGDSPLMDIFVSSKLYSTSKLGDLQRVRRFKCVHFLSDVLCADGCTVRPDILTNSTVRSSRTFSLE